jgi:hypothetical protein
MAAATAVWAAVLDGAELPGHFRKARAILNEAVAASGGQEKLAGIKTLAFTVNGKISNGLQGYKPSLIPNPAVDGRFRGENAFDFANNRHKQRTLQELPGGFDLDFTTIFKEGKIYGLANTSREYSVSDGDAGTAVLDGTSRYVPALILQKAAQNYQSVTYEGEAEIAGAPMSVLEVSWNERTRLRLFIAQGDKRLRRVAALAPDALIGDDAGVFDYYGGKDVDGLWFPERVTQSRRGAVILDLKVESAKLNAEIPATAYDVDPVYKQIEGSKMAAVKVTDNIYEVRDFGGGAYRAQFVDMGSFLVGFEAPLGYPVSRQVLGAMKKLVDKPVKYVVISHFHSDHAGGVGAYVEAGATVVTVQDNADVLTRYAQARSVFAGAKPAGDGAPKFEIVTGGTLDLAGDDGRKLTVYRLRNLPHVEEMLMLYDPASKTLMNGDMYSRLVVFNENFHAFIDWLSSSGAPLVDRIMGTHHAALTKEDLMAAGKRK